MNPTESMAKHKPHSEEYLGDARDYWWKDDFLALTAQRLGLGSCRSLVDVGCGAGHLTVKLAGLLAPGARVTGIDRETQWVQAAADRAKQATYSNHPVFRFETGAASALPLPDAEAEVTLCQTLLIHVKDPLQVLGEMKRVTKPGGLVVAIEPNNLTNTLCFDNLPPDSLEDILRAVEVNWRIEQGKKALGEGFNSLFDYRQNLAWFLAGGGSQAVFDAHCRKLERKKQLIREALEAEKYVQAGGGPLYVVAGRKPLNFTGALPETSPAPHQLLHPGIENGRK